MRRDKLAQISARAVRIPNWDALVLAGEFDGGYLRANVKPQDRLRIVRPS